MRDLRQVYQSRPPRRRHSNLPRNTLTASRRRHRSPLDRSSTVHWPVKYRCCPVTIRIGHAEHRSAELTGGAAREKFMSDSFDYVVIGAGSAGCAVAGRLSEAGVGNVCVLEAGPRDTNPFIHIPAGVIYTMHNPKVNWMYQTESSEATAGRRIFQPRGKTLGGSGAINGHIYNRGHRLDYDEWAEAGNPGWSYAEVLPYFNRSQSHLGIADDGFHGKDGPFTVTDVDAPDPLGDAFIESAESIGIPRTRDYNGAEQHGINYAQRSVHNGRRVSPAGAYLKPASRRGNTDIRTGAHVKKILFEGTRAVGVAYLQDGREHVVHANREIILSGGSISSPQILQLSGIGAPDHLADIGVDVTAPLPGVGENLRDHYLTRLVSRVNAKTANERVRGLPLAKEVLKYLFTRRGVLAMTPTLIYGFVKSDPTLERGDLQVTMTPASYPAGVQSELDDFPGVTVACWQQRPLSAGYVRARSADPLDHPEIQPNYLSHPTDREMLIKAMRVGRRIMRAEPFSNFVVNEERPGPQCESDEDWMMYAASNGNSAYHPMGSCRMGPRSAQNTVVDHELRVHGIEGLRVADASIMPNMPSANTNAACIMIGEKCADMVLGQQPLAPLNI